MSSRAQAWAWAQKVKPHPKFLLIALADRASDEGECFPGLKWIAAKTGFSPNAVRENTRRLVEAGLVKVTPRKRSDGSATSHLYQLTIPEDFAYPSRSTPRVKLVLGPPESAPPSSKDGGRSDTPSHTPNKGTTVKAFIVWFSEKYEKLLDTPYVAIWGRDTKLLKPYLQRFSLEQAQEIGVKYLESKDPFVMKSRGIPMLCNQWQRFATEGVTVTRDGPEGLQEWRSKE